MQCTGNFTVSLYLVQHYSVAYSRLVFHELMHGQYVKGYYHLTKNESDSRLYGLFTATNALLRKCVS